jgi:hypothetical protein
VGTAWTAAQPAVYANSASAEGRLLTLKADGFSKGKTFFNF